MCSLEIPPTLPGTVRHHGPVAEWEDSCAHARSAGEQSPPKLGDGVGRYAPSQRHD